MENKINHMNIGLMLSCILMLAQCSSTKSTESEQTCIKSINKRCNDTISSINQMKINVVPNDDLIIDNDRFIYIDSSGVWYDMKNLIFHKETKKLDFFYFYSSNHQSNYFLVLNKLTFDSQFELVGKNNTEYCFKDNTDFSFIARDSLISFGFLTVIESQLIIKENQSYFFNQIIHPPKQVE